MLAGAVSVLPDESSELFSSCFYRSRFGSITDFSSATGAIQSPPVHVDYPVPNQIFANQTSPENTPACMSRLITRALRSTVLTSTTDTRARSSLLPGLELDSEFNVAESQSRPVPEPRSPRGLETSPLVQSFYWLAQVLEMQQWRLCTPPLWS
jgi:hypothetical protein